MGSPAHGMFCTNADTLFAGQRGGTQTSMVVPSRIASWRRSFFPQALHCVVSEGIGDVDLVDWLFADGTQLRALEHSGRRSDKHYGGVG